ncbi:MAG: cytochrome c [Nitrospinae bacterium]|nr:cytochrome c [Nitrospinota bacterium]
MKSGLLIPVFAALAIAAGAAWAADAAKGKEVFDGPAACGECHKTTGKKSGGPGLAGTARRHSGEWLMRWLREPKKTWQENDSETMEMKKRLGLENAERPGMKQRKNLSDEELADLIEYLHTL